MSTTKRPLYEEVTEVAGHQLRCRVTVSCTYRTPERPTRLGAIGDLYAHKWRAHEPETESNK